MKKSASILLSLALFLGLALPAAAASGSFYDVAANSPYREAIQWAAAERIAAGTSDTTFSPDETCTVAQILTFLWRAKGQPEPARNTDFDNLNGNEYYAKAARWAKGEGLIGGNTFDAHAPCTRAMVAVYLWRLAGSPSAGSSGFADVSDRDAYAQAVAWAVASGVTAGTTATTFGPDEICTRGQIVTFLYRNIGGHPLTTVQPEGSAPEEGDVPPNESAPAEGSTTAGTPEEQLCARVVELVNQERAKEGLAPLSTMPSLTAAANVRAREVAQSFSHTRPDGRTCYTALEEAGIRYTAAGENIAAGTSSAEYVMDMWMGSEGHRANILKSSYTYIGVAYYNGNWVQMFAKPR